MDNQGNLIPSIVFVILVLISIFSLKLDTIWAIVIGLVGFGIVYYFLNKGNVTAPCPKGQGF